MGKLEYCLHSNSQATGSENFQIPPVTNLKAPPAPLLTFGGTDKKNLEKFFLNFEAILAQYFYSNYERFILLRGQPSGRARILIDSLGENKQSYADAKQLLQQALASPLKQAYDSIQRLLDLKLSYNQDPFEFVSEVKQIREAFRSLNIDVNTILQYGIWRAMNETLQTQFTLITNKNKPSLDDIETHMFDAIERYQIVTKRHGSRKEIKQNNPKRSNTCAINVKPGDTKDNFRPCSLCTSQNKLTEHPLYHCTKFKTATEKL